MSNYFISTLHKSYCIKDAYQMTTEQGESCLTLILNGRIEGWDVSGTFVKKLFSVDINTSPNQVIFVPNKEGKGDGLLIIENSQIVMLTLNQTEARVRSQLKLPNRKDSKNMLYLLTSLKQTYQDQYLLLGDRTCQLTVVRITQEEGYPSLVGWFSVQLDNLVLDLFHCQSLVRDQGYLNFGVLSGNQDLPMFMTVIELDPSSRSIVSSNDLKEACIRSKEGSDIFQERIYKIIEVGVKQLLLFCSHSLK